MPEANVIKEHMEVVGSDGAHIGTVDSVGEGRINLTKSDSSDDHHHYVPTSLVQDIKGNVVTLTCTASEAAEVQSRVGGEELPNDPQIGVAGGA